MSKTVVVDANVAVKWVIKEPDSDIALALLKEWTQNRFIILAPALLTYEVANVLFQNMRQGRLNLIQAQEALKNVLSMRIDLEFLEDASLSIQALELAQKFNLTATYDSHYLALAEREDCELWTADTKLWRTVQKTLPRVRLLTQYQTN